MQGTSLPAVDPVVLSSAAQTRAETTPPPQPADAAENASVTAGQSVIAVSQGTRRLVDIFA